MEPLLATLDGRHGGGPDGVPRVVLVPGEALSVIPWQAVGLPAAMAPARYACEALVLSTAVSARQLVDVAARSVRPVDEAPVLVSDPLEGGPNSRDEVLVLRAAFYPGARVYGELEGAPIALAGGGTPQEVLDLLAGALTLQHLRCHAVATDTLEAPHIELTKTNCRSRRCWSRRRGAGPGLGADRAIRHLRRRPDPVRPRRGADARHGVPRRGGGHRVRRTLGGLQPATPTSRCSPSTTS